MTYNIPSLPPCPTEDSDNCIWLASEQGNGEGQSFYTVLGETTYFTEPLALQLDFTPIIYLGLTLLLTIGLLALRRAALNTKNKNWK